MTTRDERDVETVAEALVAKVAEALRGGSTLRVWTIEDAARAVLDALDVPGIERRARAEALRDAEAEARAASRDRKMGVVARVAMRVTADWLASLIDPEGADDDA